MTLDCNKRIHSIKYLPFVVALLFGGLAVACAPAASQASQEVTLGQIELNQVPVDSTATKPSSGPATTRTLTSINSPTPISPSPTLVDAPATPTLAPTDTPSPAIPTATPTDPPLLTPVTSESVAAEMVIDGLELYRQQNCGACHRLDAAGTQGILGPPHNGLAATAETRLHDPDYTGSATSPAEYLRESIVDPGIYLVVGYNSPRTKMPAFTNLSEAQVDALVQILLQQ